MEWSLIYYLTTLPPTLSLSLSYCGMLGSFYHPHMHSEKSYLNMDLFEVLLKHLNGIQIDMKANCCNLQLYEENTCSLKNNILNRN